MRAPDAQRHIEVWEWLAAIAPGERPRPLVAIWPRGGAKSTTLELGVCYLAARRARRYALYVCETQAQADRHVQAIAAILESMGVARSLNVYGQSRGWRRQELRTADGFSVSAFGLDAGSRGVKLDDQRPDLIILDDVDGRHDGPEVVRRKIETITETVIPSGAPGCAVVFLQNLIHADSIAAQLVDGRTAMLADRLISGPHPAVESLTYETAIVDGQVRTRITGGEATWEGQPLDEVQRLIDDVTIEAVLRECQHEVARPAGQIYAVFDRARHVVPHEEPPPEWQRYLGLDFGGAHTCAVKAAERPDGRLYIYAEYLRGDRSATEHTQALLAGEPHLPFAAGGSGSEDQWRREFRTAGLPVAEPGVGPVDVGIDRVRAVLAADGLVISEQCVGLLGQLLSYAWRLDATGRPTKEIANKHAYHYLDALRYLIVRIRRGGAA